MPTKGIMTVGALIAALQTYDRQSPVAMLINESEGRASERSIWYLEESKSQTALHPTVWLVEYERSASRK